MSEFSVITNTLQDMSAGLSVISRDAADLQGQAGCHVSAAASTPLDGALGGLMARWGATLPHFGLSGERLQSALQGAAAAYRATDTAVQDAAGG